MKWEEPGMKLLAIVGSWIVGRFLALAVRLVIWQNISLKPMTTEPNLKLLVLVEGGHVLAIGRPLSGCSWLLRIQEDGTLLIFWERMGR